MKEAITPKNYGYIKYKPTEEVPEEVGSTPTPSGLPTEKPDPKTAPEPTPEHEKSLIQLFPDENPEPNIPPTEEKSMVL